MAKGVIAALFDLLASESPMIGRTVVDRLTHFFALTQ